MENTVNIIATTIIIGMAIGGYCMNNISLIGCIIDSVIFFLIGIGPSIINKININKNQQQ